MYWSGETLATADAIKETYDATATREFLIVYADENDRVLAQYTYIVMASEEDATKYQTGSAELIGAGKTDHSKGLMAAVTWGQIHDEYK